jgi:hypothetical protein
MGVSLTSQKETFDPITIYQAIWESTSASFDPGIYVANTLPPTIIRSAH